MREIEKILEEIEIRAIKDLEEENDRCSTACKGCCTDVEERKCNCRDAIIVRAFKKLAKCMNDGWIPVEECQPEEPKENPEFEGKKIELYLVTVKGAKYPFRAMWNGKFFTDGWSKCNVIAWRPLPEPYRPERSVEE
ncbi:MAG TPA: hypothetical protein H9743_00435 [Candidatus Mediterraneibacter vanvlietii]|nr:hypothetical protein [Candidatus Mediterraneibacter vanvlietii]